MDETKTQEQPLREWVPPALKKNRLKDALSGGPTASDVDDVIFAS